MKRLMGCKSITSRSRQLVCFQKLMLRNNSTCRCGNSFGANAGQQPAASCHQLCPGNAPPQTYEYCGGVAVNEQIFGPQSTTMTTTTTTTTTVTSILSTSMTQSQTTITGSSSTSQTSTVS